jgi:hypothetical protein
MTFSLFELCAWILAAGIGWKCLASLREELDHWRRQRRESRTRGLAEAAAFQRFSIGLWARAAVFGALALWGTLNLAPVVGAVTGLWRPAGSCPPAATSYA